MIEAILMSTKGSVSRVRVHTSPLPDVLVLGNTPYVRVEGDSGEYLLFTQRTFTHIHNDDVVTLYDAPPK